MEPAAVGHIRRTPVVTPAVFGDGDRERRGSCQARETDATLNAVKRRRFGGTAASVAAAEEGVAVPGAVHLATPPPPSPGDSGVRARASLGVRRAPRRERAMIGASRSGSSALKGRDTGWILRAFHTNVQSKKSEHPTQNTFS